MKTKVLLSARQAALATFCIGGSPGEDIESAVANVGNFPILRKQNLNGVINAVSDQGGELTAPILELTPLRLTSGDETPPSGVAQDGHAYQEIRVGGTAVFAGDRWVAELNPIETRTLVKILNKASECINTLPNPADPTGQITVYYEELRVDYEVQQLAGNQLELVVKPRGRIRLVEVKGEYDFEAEGLEPVQAEVRASVAAEFQHLFTRLQDLRLDGVGVGNIISRKKPALWKDLKDRWAEVFPSVQVRVEPSIRLRNTGQIRRLPQMK
jgi:hypothetical protein